MRAKNIYGDKSREGTFHFQIRAPWYLTWWAMLFYGFFGFATILGIVKIRVFRLEKRTRQLENLVKERTHIVHRQKEKLQELHTIKSRFFANISHEFRTPLTLILGPLEDMLADARYNSDKKNLGMMQRNARRILQLINQLLDLSRLESGKLKVQASPGDFPTFLKGIVMSFASLTEQKKIDLQYSVSDNENDLKNIYFDWDLVEKIFYNLLANAFKFTAQGGAVEVAVTNAQSPNFLEVRVKDNGTGIDADKLDEIFERFYQANASATREYEGTGIGLALTKELVELQRGEISVESEVGKGTEFCITLPTDKTQFADKEIGDAPRHPAAVRDDGALIVKQPPELTQASSSPV